MHLRQVLYVFALFVLAACSGEDIRHAPEADYADPEEQPSQTPVTVPETAIILLSDDMAALVEEDISSGSLETKSAGLNSVIRELGIVSMSRVFPNAGEYEPRTRREGLHKWYKVTMDGTRPLTKAAFSLGNVPGIEYVGKRHKIKRLDFDDKYFSRQWNMYNTGSIKGSKAGFDINVKPVWEKYTVGTPEQGVGDVIVAVVDGGIQLDHPDLAANCLPVGESGSKDFVDGSNTITPDRHGTHVAGIIAAVNNNSIGVCGIAGGDFASGKTGVKLMSCQIFSGNYGTDDVASAIKWSADNGAIISQNSWGYDYDDDGDGYLDEEETKNALEGEIDEVDRVAVDYFIKYAGCDNDGNQLPSSPMKGGICIFAAGNEAMENGAPANYDPIIAVGAVNSAGSRAYYTCYGPWVDIAAPGSSILSTVTDSGYDYISGTSMACPHVSGVAALVAGYHGGRGFTNKMLEERLIKGANSTDFSLDNQIGPLLDALGAITYPGGSARGDNPNYPPVVTLSRREITLHAHESARVSVSVSDPEGDGFEVSLDGGSSAVSLSPASASGGDGGEYVLTIVGRNAGAGTYDAVITAEDDHGARTSAFFSYTILVNHAPEVVGKVENDIISPGGSGSVPLSGLLTDPDGETPVISVSSDNSCVNVSLDGETLVYSGSKNGIATITITGTDALGLSASLVFKVVVRDPGVSADIYPNPVSTVLYIRTGISSMSATARLFTTSGKMIIEKTVECDAFNPMSIDMTSCAPGRYILKVIYGSLSDTFTVVKL